MFYFIALYPRLLNKYISYNKKAVMSSFESLIRIIGRDQNTMSIGLEIVKYQTIPITTLFRVMRFYNGTNNPEIADALRQSVTSIIIDDVEGTHDIGYLMSNVIFPNMTTLDLGLSDTVLTLDWLVANPNLMTIIGTIQQLDMDVQIYTAKRGMTIEHYLKNGKMTNVIRDNAITLINELRASDELSAADAQFYADSVSHLILVDNPVRLDTFFKNVTSVDITNMPAGAGVGSELDQLIVAYPKLKEVNGLIDNTTVDDIATSMSRSMTVNLNGDNISTRIENGIITRLITSVAFSEAQGMNDSVTQLTEPVFYEDLARYPSLKLASVVIEDVDVPQLTHRYPNLQEVHISVLPTYIPQHNILVSMDIGGVVYHHKFYNGEWYYSTNIRYRHNRYNGYMDNIDGDISNLSLMKNIVVGTRRDGANYVSNEVIASIIDNATGQVFFEEEKASRVARLLVNKRKMDARTAAMQGDSAQRADTEES